MHINCKDASGKLIEYLPELREQYEVEAIWWGEETPGPHVIYGDILNPYIDQLLKSKDETELRRVFDFVEMLAQSANRRVQELVSVTICEYLGSNREQLGQAKRFMGPATTKLSNEIEGFWT